MTVAMTLLAPAAVQPIRHAPPANDSDASTDGAAGAAESGDRGRGAARPFSALMRDQQQRAGQKALGAGAPARRTDAAGAADASTEAADAAGGDARIDADPTRIGGAWTPSQGIDPAARVETPSVDAATARDATALAAAQRAGPAGTAGAPATTSDAMPVDAAEGRRHASALPAPGTGALAQATPATLAATVVDGDAGSDAAGRGEATPGRDHADAARATARRAHGTPLDPSTLAVCKAPEEGDAASMEPMRVALPPPRGAVDASATVHGPAALPAPPEPLLPGPPVDAAPLDVDLATPVGAPAFPAALGLQVSVLTKDGVQRAELHLHPADLGPVSVQIALDGTAARVEFGADVAATRAAIEAGLADLASALHEAGFTLAGGGVSARARERERDADADAAGTRAVARRADDADGVERAAAAIAERARASNRRGGVDLYA